MRARVKNPKDIPEHIFCCQMIRDGAEAKKGAIITVEPAPQYKTWTCSACGTVHKEPNVLMLVMDGYRDTIMPTCTLDFDEGETE